MADGEEAVENRGSAYVDNERTNVATIIFFLRNMLIKELDMRNIKYYHITTWGRQALVEPDFDSQSELEKLKNAQLR